VYNECYKHKGEEMKTKPIILWKCNGVRPTTQSCTNSIVCNKDDERLQRIGKNIRYYSCDECLNKFNKHFDAIEKKMFIEIFGK
jgi:lipopolysaccharide/colanic/teichoic acid biosynthesis glycosyltransferase